MSKLLHLYQWHCEGLGVVNHTLACVLATSFSIYVSATKLLVRLFVCKMSVLLPCFHFLMYYVKTWIPLITVK